MLAIFILIILFLYFVVPLIYPFLIGWAIAYFLNPLVNLLHRKVRLPRFLAVAVSILLFLGIAAAILTLLTINMISEIGTLTNTIQANINDWKDQVVQYVNSAHFQNIIANMNTFFTDNPKYASLINTNLTSAANTLKDFSSHIVVIIFNLLLGIVKSLPSLATVTIIGILATFFISKDWNKLFAKFAAYFSENTRKSARSIWGDLEKALFGYIRAQLILITITALVVLIGLIIIHVKYALTLSIIIGFFDLMPYLGTGAFMVPWIAFVFIQGNVSLGISLSILYTIILVARQTFEPKVLASSVGLNAFAILIALFVGLKLFGVIGLLIGPVTLIILTACNKANVFRDIRNYVVNGSIVIKDDEQF